MDIRAHRPQTLIGNPPDWSPVSQSPQLHRYSVGDLDFSRESSRSRWTSCVRRRDAAPAEITEAVPTIATATQAATATRSDSVNFETIVAAIAIPNGTIAPIPKVNHARR
jgi:hypothetical protein